MLDTIREIGIFMIAAQAIVHFAPAVQYEKYIKSVSGVIILLLFLKPVLQLAGAAWEEPQMLWERWNEMTDMPELSGTVRTDGVSDEVISRMEAEIAERLNRELAGDVYAVSRVSLRFSQKTEEAETLLPEITIWLRESAETGAEEGGQIGIEKIEVGRSGGLSSDVAFSAYRTRFAALLGMEENRVEVRRDGRG